MLQFLLQVDYYAHYVSSLHALFQHNSYVLKVQFTPTLLNSFALEKKVATVLIQAIAHWAHYQI